MGAQHTPGPWVASCIGDWWMVVTEANHDVGDDDEPRPIPVVDLHHGGYDWSDSNLGDIEGNARLIAAAPELLEALIEVRRVGDDKMAFRSEWAAAVRKADAAIAKARGEVA